jgi:hypothetical protein
VALFDDPVEAEVNGQPVLWLGTETSRSGGALAVIVSASGHASLVELTSVRAKLRYVGTGWINGNDQDAAAAATREAQDFDHPDLGTAGVRERMIGSDAKPEYPDAVTYPKGTIFDSSGYPYTADGDPIDLPPRT